MSAHDRLTGLLVTEYKLRPEQLQADARLDELGVDSLGVMELLFKIEDEFQIQVPTDAVQITTIGELVTYIENLVAEQASHVPPSRAAS